MGRRKGAKETGAVAARRRAGAQRRAAEKAAIVQGLLSDPAEPLVPEVFEAIRSTYWACLQAVPDPRAAGRVVYPLYLILHRIVTGLLGGARYIGVLFPKRRGPTRAGPRPGRRLGALPTAPAVYKRLRPVDWSAAPAALAPLWERLGHPPELVMRRGVRDTKLILEAFRAEVAEQAAAQQAAQRAAARAAEKQGRSAAQALRQGHRRRKKKPAAKVVAPPTAADPAGASAPAPRPVAPPVAAPRPAPSLGGPRPDLLLDGKVVRASYNGGGPERFVHLTAVRLDEEAVRQRFLVGVQRTEQDRHGEWGAGLALLESLQPRRAPWPVLISGDAGLCVEEHAQWLAARELYYLFRLKANAGGLFDRLIAWADDLRHVRPAGDYFESSRSAGDDAHSRRLWRRPGLQHASFPGITEGFMIEKKVC